jgi:hypothetical protein
VGAARSAALVTLHFRSILRRKMKLRLQSKPVWDSALEIDPSFFLRHRGRAPGKKLIAI